MNSYDIDLIQLQDSISYLEVGQMLLFKSDDQTVAEFSLRFNTFLIHLFCSFYKLKFSRADHSSNPLDLWKFFVELVLEIFKVFQQAKRIDVVPYYYTSSDELHID